MFSGIIEAQSRLIEIIPSKQIAQLKISRPENFDDIKIGDSISVDGVCLTLESFDSDFLQFALGAETLNVTNWKSAKLDHHFFNMERSLRLSDRVHGHFVTGHTDGIGEAVELQDIENNKIIRVKVANEQLFPMIWKKGSIALNGVSLTVNEITGGTFSVCLIPETLRRTNLSAVKIGDKLNIEVDSWARATLRALEQIKANREHNS